MLDQEGQAGVLQVGVALKQLNTIKGQKCG